MEAFLPPPWYLDLTFTRDDTTTLLFRDILRRHPQACNGLVEYSFPGLPKSISVAAADFLDVPPNTFTFHGSARIVLDYTVSHYLRAHVVPQHRFVAYGGTARLRRELVTPPMFLIRDDGSIGLPLDVAQSVYADSLLSQGSWMPFDGKSTVKIRIAWPGYLTYEGQIQLRRGREKSPMTFAMLVRLSAKRIEAFLLSAQRSTDIYGGDPRWRIADGPSHHHGITPADVVLVGLVAVSPGSIMPIFQLGQ